MMQNETIVSKAYDLLKYAVPVLNQMPKSQKFVLGDRVQNNLSDLLDRLVEAFYAPAAGKRALLDGVNVLLEKSRYYIRLGYDLGYYNSTRYHDFAKRLDEIGRMNGGWLKSLK